MVWFIFVMIYAVTLGYHSDSWVGAVCSVVALLVGTIGVEYAWRKR